MKNKENKLDNNNFALGELPNESKTKLGEKKKYYIIIVLHQKQTGTWSEMKTKNF